MQKIGHQRDDIRLRDRLTVSDIEGPVAICRVADLGWNELVTRYLAHGLEHTRIDLPVRFRSPCKGDDLVDHRIALLSAELLRMRHAGTLLRDGASRQRRAGDARARPDYVPRET